MDDENSHRFRLLIGSPSFLHGVVFFDDILGCLDCGELPDPGDYRSLSYILAVRSGNKSLVAGFPRWREITIAIDVCSLWVYPRYVVPHSLECDIAKQTPHQPDPRKKCSWPQAFQPLEVVWECAKRFSMFKANLAIHCRQQDAARPPIRVKFEFPDKEKGILTWGDCLKCEEYLWEILSLGTMNAFTSLGVCKCGGHTA